MKQQTQNQLIKDHLENKGAITSLEAVYQYGCLRLAARISDLRRDGMEITTNFITKNGATFASYEAA